jgi:malonate transporter
MIALIQVIAPVFLLIGAGYAAARARLLGPEAIDALLRFAQLIAIPALLFRAMSTLDLAQSFDVAMLAAFFGGAALSFAICLAGARRIFGRPIEESVAIGFCGMFSNTVMLGLAVGERAYGAAALPTIFAIIALHAPVGYLIGISAMEAVRSRGMGPMLALGRVVRGMFGNVFVLALVSGLLLNLGGIVLPEVLTGTLDMIGRAALPVAIFALGGVLARYSPAGDVRLIGFVAVVSLVLHPALTLGIGRVLGVAPDALRAAVIVAAMAPGINTYVFAGLYGVGQRVAAATVLVATAACVLTALGWLAILG